MKICYIIAEYNPFHLGHLKQIEYAKSVLGAEKIIVVLSGNFTQRGEPAIMNKFIRASHAIKAGADAVIELPTVFALSNAETFALGAIKIIDSLNMDGDICFGVESGNKEDFIKLASLLNNETKEFKNSLKKHLDSGKSLAQSKLSALKEIYGTEFDENLMTLPNNILGLEYTKAILKAKNTFEIQPLIRENDHSEEKLKKGITSAMSIRNCIKCGQKKKTAKCMPKYVYADIKDYPFMFDNMLMANVITSSTQDFKQITDCTEGLENRIKALEKDIYDVESLVEMVSTKRYPKSRIRRIIAHNLLGINDSLLKRCLKDCLYIKLLAVKGQGLDQLIGEIKRKAQAPLLTRKSDCVLLEKTALDCFNIDIVANELYNLAKKEKENPYRTVII